MTLRERVHWILRMALTLFILASIAFLSALTAMRFAVQGREVLIPDLVGKPAGEAQMVLQARGVGMKVEDRIYSALPVDAVVRQSPPPNMSVKRGQFAHVALSLGPQKQTIPQLGQKSLRAARIDLLRSALQSGEVSSFYSSAWPVDTVIGQDPAPGTTDVTSPHVDLLVSLGTRPPAFVMPELTGLPVNEAEARLSGAGLKVSKLTPSSIPGEPHGVVVGQTPVRGQKLDESTPIGLEVAE